MTKKVIQVRPNQNFTVHVFFEDGAIKLYDLTPLLGKGVFKKISTITDFISKCTVMNDTLAWDLSGKFDPSDCIDIDPETIFNTALDVIDKESLQFA